MLNPIIIPRGTSRTITVDLSTNIPDLSTYSPYLTVRKDFDSSILLDKIGTIDSSIVTFIIVNNDTSMGEDNYLYGITLDNSTYTYPVVDEITGSSTQLFRIEPFIREM